VDQPGKGKLEQIQQALGKARSVLIMTHNNPDPDSLGAAFGFRYLLMKKYGLRVTIGYGGIIGRAENKTMVGLLRVSPTPLSKIKSRKFGALVICDSQPASKNHEMFGQMSATIVLDHHPIQRGSKSAKFTDVRPDYGATCTIVSEYLNEAGIVPDARTATALYYGIKTDIADLARPKSKADEEALRRLFPFISVRWLHRIEHPRVPPEYFQTLKNGMEGARIIKNAVVCCLGEIHQPDSVAEMADFLLKLEGMRWSFCIGCVGQDVVFSIRSLVPRVQAGRIANKLVRKRKGAGGGHNMSAGGRMKLTEVSPDDREQVCQRMIGRFLGAIGLEGAPVKKLTGPDPKTEDSASNAESKDAS
jgi:nanoRNase/pAp phosphatase (c-di-AMP/oligoRNAs hydrolase)